MSNPKIFKEGQVEQVNDDNDGLRIKVRLFEDGYTIKTSELPWCFPLLPKTIQSIPKIGEAVFVFNGELSNGKSTRLYIGPIISQYQHFEHDEYQYGRGSAACLLPNNILKPLKRISNFDITKGAFPNANDIALIGRKSEDVILKDGEIDLRCGIRSNNLDRKEEDLIGDVIFNTLNPSYIQLKYKKNMTSSQNQAANSMVNIVADKINIISHQDKNAFNLTDNKDLIPQGQLDLIMSQLHVLPYGDVLKEYLQTIIMALTTHVHPYPGLPPCQDANIVSTMQLDLNELNSPHVRIS